MAVLMALQGSIRASGQLPRLPCVLRFPSLGHGSVPRRGLQPLQVTGARSFSVPTPGCRLRSQLIQASLRGKPSSSLCTKESSQWARITVQQRRWSAQKSTDSKDTQNTEPKSKTAAILSKIPRPTTHENIYTVPNILTLTRLVAAPLVGYFLVQGHHTAALGLFAYAGITDLVDGWIARRWNLQTVVGTIIDPMADKLLMTIGVACLAVNGSIPVWLAFIILGRDVGLALSAIYYRWISLPPPKTMARYWDFSLPSAEVKPTTVSKVNTALQLLLVGSAIGMPVLPETVIDAWHLKEAMTAFQYLVAGTTIWSGLSYVFSKDAVKILTKEEVQKRIARAAGKK